MPEIIFQAENITKQYRKLHLSTFKYKTYSALKGFDMEIRRGDIYGFIGQNGAGKTTLIRILAGFSEPTAGKLSLFQEGRPEYLHKQRSRINGIIETPALTPGLTARDNLKVCCIQRGIDGKGCIDAALKTVGLRPADIGGLKVKNFSLGMKQRLGIAMALLGNPEFLFFDEPLNGLDPVGIRDFNRLVKMLNKEHGITILISSHILGELSQIATCYGFIHKGQMLEQISSDVLQEKFHKYLLIKVDDVLEAERILKAWDSTCTVEVISQDTIHLYGRLDKNGEIMKELITKGMAVEEITVKGDDLKKHYMSLIKNF